MHVNLLAEICLLATTLGTQRAFAAPYLPYTNITLLPTHDKDPTSSGASIYEDSFDEHGISGFKLPSIKIVNNSTNKDGICFRVELSSGGIEHKTHCPFNLPGIFVPSGRNLTIFPSADFNGAITTRTINGSHLKRGTRHEINFADLNRPGTTWYDIDYELGMTPGTLGPSDGRNRTDGGPSLTGEKRLLAKANLAWPRIKDKAKLLAYPGYIEQNDEGNLVKVHMDPKAPWIVRWFYQIKANFNAYVFPGSIAGKPTDEVARKADKHSFHVDTQNMTIITY